MATNLVDTSDFIGRALLVEGISSVHSQYQTADKLTIHFQKKGNRGGDVTKLIYPLESNLDAAIVVFDDAKDRETALLHRHVFNGISLKVQRLPPVFRSVEIEIDPFYATLLPDVAHNLMSRYGSLMNPSLGTQNAHKLSFPRLSEFRSVEEEVYKNIGRHSKTGHLSSAATDYSFPEQAMQVGLTQQEGIIHKHEAVMGKERNRYQSESEETELEFFVDHRLTERDDFADHAVDYKKIEENETSTSDAQMRDLSEQSSDYGGDGSSIQTDQSVVLDMFSYYFLMKYEKVAVDNIFKNLNVRITENKDLSLRATFKARKSNTPKEEIHKAVEEFTLLYQTTNNKLHRKAVDCPPSISKDVLKKAALKTSEVFNSNALITLVDRNPICYVILSSNNAEEVAQHFRKAAGIPSKKKLRTANPTPDPENKETVPEQNTDWSATTNQSMTSDGSYGQKKTDSLSGSSALHSSQTPGDTFVTNEGMTICLRKGDITRQHEVHAIVNPTDYNLRNSAGASKAIGTAAGPQLNKWCDQYMQNLRGQSLQGSECCVSPGFDLSCRFIIHIATMIVPYNHNKQQLMKILNQTFTNCLQAAHVHKVKSLAMPLLGSGAAGAPKEACARSLVQALIDFSCVPSRVLCEVYLVNIDSEANRALKQNLTSAFKETKSTLSCDQHSSTAEMSPLDKSTYVTENRPTHNSGQMPTERNLAITHPIAEKGYKSTTEKGQSDTTTNFGARPITEETLVDSTNATSQNCPICLSNIVDVKVLKCNHRFCRKCIDKCFEQSHLCPVCRAVCAEPKGNQPEGFMTSFTSPWSHLPGYSDVGTITIRYHIPSGKQSKFHPHPGNHFTGITRNAYLPDNREGKKVFSLLRKAFDAGLVFTVGQSISSGCNDTVTWNDIHHKTSQTGGPSAHGYPDSGYLKRVKEDLAALGIK